MLKEYLIRAVFPFPPRAIKLLIYFTSLSFLRDCRTRNTFSLPIESAQSGENVSFSRLYSSFACSIRAVDVNLILLTRRKMEKPAGRAHVSRYTEWKAKLWQEVANWLKEREFRSNSPSTILRMQLSSQLRSARRSEMNARLSDLAINAIMSH